jgi:hypothetical protein
MSESTRYQGTRLLLPAPRETRKASQITWYEVEVIPGEKRGRLVAYDAQRSELGVAEVSRVGDGEGRLNISDGDVSLTVSVALSTTDAGEIELRGRINDDAFTITGAPPATSAADSSEATARRDGELHLDAAQSAMAGQWALLADPLTTLGEAVAASGMDGSWGCTSCMVLLGGMLVGTLACMEGALPACAADLYAGATYIENCHDVCG